MSSRALNFFQSQTNPTNLAGRRHSLSPLGPFDFESPLRAILDGEEGNDLLLFGGELSLQRELERKIASRLTSQTDL